MALVVRHLWPRDLVVRAIDLASDTLETRQSVCVCNECLGQRPASVALNEHNVLALTSCELYRYMEDVTSFSDNHHGCRF